MNILKEIFAKLSLFLLRVHLGKRSKDGIRLRIQSDRDGTHEVSVEADASKEVSINSGDPHYKREEKENVYELRRSRKR